MKHGVRADLTRQGGLARKVGVGLLIALVLGLAYPAEAQSPAVYSPVPNATFVENGSNPYRLYGVPGAALVMNAGEIRGPRDVQLGWWDPAVPSLVNGDIGAGSTEHPGILNLGADVSAAVRIQAAGRTVLRAEAGTVSVCDQRGCFDLLRRLRVLSSRLHRVVQRLHAPR